MEFRAKRELGEGRWDKILKRKLTELSVSDNYDDAKHEWIATGEVWWSGNTERPEWINHAGSCLCGHKVVYHFQILNTENDVIECVGSDHINTYLIMRAIAEDGGLDINNITDEQIQEWIDVRTKSMKAEAWWKESGASFELMFDAVKEIDLHFNTRDGETIYNNKYEWNEPKKQLRKRSENAYGSEDYHMASVVWRWNHPENPKAQINTTGYPNDNLMKDLALLYIKSGPLHGRLNDQKKRKEERLAQLAAYTLKRETERLERHARYEARQAEELRVHNLPENVEKRAEEDRLRDERRAEQVRLNKIAKDKHEERRRLANIEVAKANTITLESTNSKFINLCGYYGIPVFDDSFASNDWERRFLASIKEQLLNDKPMSRNQLTSLKPIFMGAPATEKQINYLRALGVEDFTGTKKEASRKIDELKE